MTDSDPHCCDLAIALGSAGRHREAADHAKRATQLRPDLAKAWNVLGVALEHLGSHADAVAAYDRAIALNSADAVVHTNRGNALWKLGRVADAETAHRQANAIEPTLARSYDNLARVLADQGRIDDVLACYRRGLSHCPDSAATESNLLLAMHYDARYSPQELYAAARRWAQRHAEPLTRVASPHTNARNPNRRLRIGYVSADFREHPVGWLLEPILAARNRAGFEIYCYAYGDADRQTEKLKALADVWRSVTGISDPAVAEQIRRDQIDVLVDLGGHFGNNHLLLFARKPAPIQVSFLNYPDTTGMSAMDYRLTDSLCDPPGTTDRWHSEKLLRLHDGPWYYEPPVNCPEVSSLPARSAGFVTFCNLNNPMKTSPIAVQTWAAILRAVPNSRLMLQSRESCRSFIEQQFVNHGIDAGRLAWVTPRRRAEYMALYQHADIALDPFPFNGGITTCDALWMGLPAVTLTGGTCSSRRGLAFMSHVRLPEFIAADARQYLEIATTAAGDPCRLDELRRGLRARVCNSPLRDLARFVSGLEGCLRVMWKNSS